MEQLNIDFKNRVAEMLTAEKEKRGYVDTAFLNQYGISKQVLSKMLLGHRDHLLQDAEWLRIGRKLGAVESVSEWKPARTDIFTVIEEDIDFCQRHAKAKICVDECGVGKTFTAKYLSKTRYNCFYVDASQGKSISLFTRVLAKAIGLNSSGKYIEVKEDIKAYLKMIPNPLVIVDEAGDLGQNTLQEIKEFWNATEGYCGWYLMGADGLKYILEKGIKSRKPGFKEIFSRFSDRFTTIVPIGKEDKIRFYRKLITDVLTANMTDKSNLNEIVRRCMIMDANGNISGLRRAESLLILYTN